MAIVFWELTHWNHVWRPLWSVSRKQLLITTSLQIWYIRNTKENICLKLMKKLHDSCSCSFIQSIHLLLQICVHSLQGETVRPISSFISIIRMCWPNVACCVVDVCVKLQMQSVTTSDKHCTSSAIEFCGNWTSIFQLGSGAKHTTKSAWQGKGSKTCDMLQTAAWKCWTELDWKLKRTLEWTGTNYEIFRC